MPLITQDAHCPTFPRMGSLPDSLALHQWLKDLSSWNSSRRPLDALGAASGTAKYIVIILSGEHPWDMAKEAHGTQTQVAAASLELLECLCQTRRPQRCPQGEVGASSGILGWAPTCHSNTRVCSEVASGQCFGWAQDKNHFRRIIFTAQSRKGLSDHSARAWILLTVSFFLFSSRFFTSSRFPSPWQGSSEQGFSTSCHYTFTSSLPGNFPSISTAVLPSKQAQIIFPVNI